MKHVTSIMALLSVLIFTGGVVDAQELQSIKLPTVALKNDKLFMQAVKDRKSNREFSEKELSLQDLSNILWCANGVNRPETGGRTSPSAMNKQDVDLYVILKEGIYLYEAKKHELVPVVSGDYRRNAGTQPYVGAAPLNLIYVSDISKFDFLKNHEEQVVTAAIGAGHCSQNVYLYGAAAGLAVVTRTSVDKAKMADVLKLRPQQVIIMGQTVGYPKSSSK
ncbi:MAG: SagB/ThcOx family dehydrogenase [Candidatus Eisenbacteria bacterium]|nr:SagB/ThcOx family dehydrogenase [Candidatus Eisenbacteria bacterium]